MRQLFLALVLITVPVAAFTAFHLWTSKAAAIPSPGLGAMSGFVTIVMDVQRLASAGDLAAAKTRIADLETAWDDGEATLRPINPTLWGNVDAATDAALSALRDASPAQDKVSATLAALLAVLNDPAQATDGGKAGPAGVVDGVAVTDEGGRPIPCETMLTSLRSALTTAVLSAADKTAAVDFLAKATERCNADDDARSDEFSAHGLALTLK